MLKMGDSAKVVIKQDMKGRRHKYGFNNNERKRSCTTTSLTPSTGSTTFFGLMVESFMMQTNMNYINVKKICIYM